MYSKRSGLHVLIAPNNLKTLAKNMFLFFLYTTIMAYVSQNSVATISQHEKPPQLQSLNDDQLRGAYVNSLQNKDYTVSLAKIIALAPKYTQLASLQQAIEAANAKVLPQQFSLQLHQNHLLFIAAPSNNPASNNPENQNLLNNQSISLNKADVPYNNKSQLIYAIDLPTANLEARQLLKDLDAVEIVQSAAPSIDNNAQFNQKMAQYYATTGSDKISDDVGNIYISKPPVSMDVSIGSVRMQNPNMK